MSFLDETRPNRAHTPGSCLLVAANISNTSVGNFLLVRFSNAIRTLRGRNSIVLIAVHRFSGHHCYDDDDNNDNIIIRCFSKM